MNRITRSLLACLLVLCTIASCVAPLSGVFAATYNVEQSRRVAEPSEFPESYQAGLNRIKAKYPNAKFIYYDTGLDWYTDLLSNENQMRLGRNLIPSSSPSSWKSTEPNAYDPTTDTYVQIEPGWNQASQAVVEYYMDPRNFFNERDIFQFVNLEYDDSQTVEATESLLNGTFMSKTTIVDNNGNSVTYAKALYDIGKRTGVSPYLLACRIVQEQGGGGGSALISGTYSAVPGYYNFFNIAAAGSTTQAIITNGLNYAKAHGWNTKYKAIEGGAEVLANNYVGSGKNTLYLQHFNVTANDQKVVNYSIYMANTLAPYYENKNMSSSYKSTTAEYTFIIPVYNNMPETPRELPAGDGNGAHTLSTISLNDGTVDFGVFDPYTYKYNATANGIKMLSISGAAHSNKSNIYINGHKVTLTDKDTFENAIVLVGGFNTVTVTVEAENGLCRDYVFEILNDDGKAHYRSTKTKLTDSEVAMAAGQTTGSILSNIETLNCSALIVNKNGLIKGENEICASGDKIIIKTADNKVAYVATINIKGDINQDGFTDSDDVRMVINHLLESKALSQDKLTSADLDKDGQITLQDLGELKVLTSGVNMVTTTPTIYPVISDDLRFGEQTSIRMHSNAGSYLVEGYLYYNEGKVTAVNSDNSGQIHFIADGDNVIFDNDESELQILTEIQSGTIDFSVKIVNAYDYCTNQEITVETRTTSTSVKHKEIDISLVFDTKNQRTAMLTISNSANKSIGNIRVELGNGLTTKDGEISQHLGGLMPREKASLEIFADDSLNSGAYTTNIKVFYQNARGVERLVQYAATFIVDGHNHSKEWEFDDTHHFKKCNVCTDGEKSEHVYQNVGNNVYQCAVCRKELSYEMSLTVSGGLVNEAMIVTPNIDSSVVQYDWYVDGIKTSNKDTLAIIFKSVGIRRVDCVAILENGMVITDHTYVNVNKNSNNNGVSVKEVTCNSIELNKVDGAQYKINNSPWQTSNVFNNLQPGKEYIVTQKVGGTTTNIIVYVNHNETDDKDATISCAGVVVLETCKHCNETISYQYDACVGHVFAEFIATERATCQHGTVKTALCEYGCESTMKYTMPDVASHAFTNYVSDNNTSCVSGGSQTATCNYGCGKTDTIANTTDAYGHDYIYQVKSVATADSCTIELGTCSRCGKENERYVDGSRLTYIYEVRIEISKARALQTSLPSITADEKTTIKATTWKNSAGVILNNDSAMLRNGEVYTLSNLVIETDATKYIFATNAKLFINGKEFGDVGIINDNTIEFLNVGRFEMSK